jgi:hypothetical protein
MSSDYFHTAFQCLGMWWVPGKEAEARCGELRYDPRSGILLTLVGEFTLPRELRPDNALSTYPILLGRVVDCPHGDVVTLSGCNAIRAVHSIFGGLGTEALAVDRAFFGLDLETEEDFRFDHANVYIDQLTNWITESTLNIGVEFEGDIPTNHSVRFESTPPVEAVIDDCRISIEFLRELPLGFSRTPKVAETPFFSIAYGEPKPVDTILRNAVFPLQNLSTLASDHISELTAVELQYRNATGARKHVRLLFQQIPERSEPVRYLYAEQMLFTTRDLPFVEMVEHWIPFATAFSEICDLYFSVVYGRGLLRDAAFFMLMQVAEAYHRERYPGPEIPQEEYDAKKLKSIVDSAPPEYRTWLKEKLRYANELTLRKRLRAIVADDREAMASVVNDEASFIGKLVDTRNYMAHRTDELRLLAASGVELHYLSVKLRVLLKLCFLRELACTVDERKVIIARHLRFSQLAYASRTGDDETKRLIE